MAFEYFSSFPEALAVFTDEQRSRDLQEFVIAIGFCKRFEIDRLEGSNEAKTAVKNFQTYLQSLEFGYLGSVDQQAHDQITEQAKIIASLLR